MRLEITKPQQKLLRFLEERQEKGEPPPTMREICGRLRYRSTRAAFDVVAALQRKGLIVREKSRARGIRLVQQHAGVPVLGRIAAGHARGAVSDPEDRLALDPRQCGIRDRSKAFALRVSGDSMTGRRLFDGDIVLLEAGAEPRDGDIVAALIDTESTLKTLIMRDGKSWLRAENPNYPDLIPAWDLQVQGVARAVMRFLRK
jgi:repressor LexA